MKIFRLSNRYKNNCLNIIEWLLELLLSPFKFNKNIHEKFDNPKVLVIKPDHIGDLFINLNAYHFFNQIYKPDYVINPCAQVLFEQFNKVGLKSYCFRHFMHSKESSLVRRFLNHVKDTWLLCKLLRDGEYTHIILARLAPGNLLLHTRFFTSACIIGSDAAAFDNLNNICYKHDCNEFEYVSQLRLIGDFEITDSYQKKYHHDDILVSNELLLLPNSRDLSREYSEDFWLAEIKRTKFSTIVIAGDRSNDFLELKLTAEGFNVKNYSNMHNLRGYINFIEKYKNVYCVESFASHYCGAIGLNVRVYYKNPSNLPRWSAVGIGVTVGIVRD